MEIGRLVVLPQKSPVANMRGRDCLLQPVSLILRGPHSTWTGGPSVYCTCNLLAPTPSQVSILDKPPDINQFKVEFLGNFRGTQKCPSLTMCMTRTFN